MSAPRTARTDQNAEGFQDILDEDSKRRLYTNPLRVLDTKNPALQEMAANAPKLIDFLGESLAHFDGVQRLLKANNVPFTINPRLVRGLDLQPDRVRVDHGQARRAGYHRRRWPLRSADQPDGWQGGRPAAGPWGSSASSN